MAKKAGDKARVKKAGPKSTQAVKAAKPSKPAKATAGGGAGGWYQTSAQFLREVVSELKRVTWPSRRQTISSTGVVLVLVILVAAYLGLVDYLLSGFVRWVIG